MVAAHLNLVLDVSRLNSKIVRLKADLSSSRISAVLLNKLTQFVVIRTTNCRGKDCATHYAAIELLSVIRPLHWSRRLLRALK